MNSRLQNNRPAPSAWLHRISFAVLLATFPLVFMGGLVTTTGAGMSVPDWPNTYGYNMFLFPPSMWIGGIFYEHTHRLLGCLVGLLAIVQTVVACRSRLPLSTKLLASSVLLAVILQGLLGGLRVTEVNIHLAVAHGIFGQLVLCLMAAVCVVTSRWWFTARCNLLGSDVRRVYVAGAVVTALIVGQLVLGAFMRHYGAGLAIPDIPLAYGKLLPPTDAAGLAEANRARVALADPTLKPVNLAEIWMHFGHRIGAVIVTFGVVWLAVVSHRNASGAPKVNGLARLLVILIALQVALGLFTVYDRKPADLTTLHHTVGALCLMTVVVLTLRARHLARRAVEEAPETPVSPSPQLATA
jgi:heme a synthase